MKLYNMLLASLFSILALAGCDSDKDLTVVEIPVKPYEIENLWMVGNATSADWDIDNPVRMEKIDDNTFKFEGRLNEGEMKCPMEPGNWGGAFIMPVTGGTIINSNGVESDEIALMPNGSPDNKWQVTEAGNYKIVIDGNKHKIHVTCMK